MGYRKSSTSSNKKTEDLNKHLKLENKLNEDFNQLR